MRVLLVEDNRRLSNVLRLSLVEEGYAVDLAYDGLSGQELAQTVVYDIIILDVMLPLKDGLEVCRALRRERVNTPIIMLTARDTTDDRVRGLDSGADDYLVKPFAMKELLARLRSLLRRDAPVKLNLVEVGDLAVDMASHLVERQGQTIELTAREYAMLEFFMRHVNQVVTREIIENHIWNYDFESSSNVVDVYVRRLRRKIDDPFEIKLFETLRGVGYRLRRPEPASVRASASQVE